MYDEPDDDGAPYGVWCDRVMCCAVVLLVAFVILVAVMFRDWK